MRIVRRIALAAALFAPTAGSAAAQAATPATHAPATDLGGKPGTLSDKLGDADGVIRPTENVDPGIRKPAPHTGSMPVVRPGTVAPGTAK